MKVINPSYEILSHPSIEDLKALEYIGRTCYKSEKHISDMSAERFVKNLIDKGHEAIIEHAYISVKFICDRGISHEIVRHRLASFAQESTRYCNYTSDKFNNHITVIKPVFYGDTESVQFKTWFDSCMQSEQAYFKLIGNGSTPEEARCVLPNSLKTELVMTANLREWRHFFKLRAADITGKAHPQIKQLTIPLLKELQNLLPVIFDDIIVGDKNV